MRKSKFSLLLGLVLALASISIATAQGPAPAQKGASSGASSPSAAAKSEFAPLKGVWIRPDGGYVIVIRSIGPGGELDAKYFNPNSLPFAKAQAFQDGATLRAFFELRAGGYAGSTYELAYDPASDRLTGIYYQAVAKRKFAVSFARK